MNIVPGNTPYTAQAVSLDGSTFLANEGLAAPTDNGTWSGAFWFKMPTNGGGGVLWVVDPNGTYPSNGYFNNPNVSNHLFHQQFCRPDDNACWNANPPADNTPVLLPRDDNWRCIMTSIDTNHLDPNKVYKAWLGDTELTYSFVSSGPSGALAFIPNFNGFPLYVFDDGFGDGIVCDMADFWMAPGQYIDFSVEANRRKFIDVNGKPVDLGADGSTPTGTAPAVFFSGGAASFATNKGSGGSFALTGSLTNATTSLSD